MIRSIAAILLLAAAAHADTVTGKWTGTATMKAGDDTHTLNVTLTLKQTGETALEGTSQAEGEPESIAITAGRVDGAKVYFEVKADGDGMPILFRVHLTQDGDRLSGTFTRQAGGQTIQGEVKVTRQQ